MGRFGTYDSVFFLKPIGIITMTVKGNVALLPQDVGYFHNESNEGSLVMGNYTKIQDRKKVHYCQQSLLTD